jgi:hypothetical protein
VSLRAQAAADLAMIHADTVGGFGWSISVTNPEGVTAVLTGLSTDVHTSIDPETGVVVPGRRASVSLVRAHLATAGLGQPRGINGRNEKPWLVTFLDVDGASHTFKVVEALPDRAIGSVVCILEHYVP